MCAKMAGFHALGFCNARNVGAGCFCSVTSLAEDLQVIRFICATHGQRQNVINVPRLASVDFLRAGCACALPLQEEVQPERG